MYKKIISTLWLTAIFSIIFIIVSTETVEAKTYQVGTSQLNMRAAPDMSASVVGSLTGGATVEGLDEQFGWVKINANGATGWVASQFLLAESTQTSSQSTDAYKSTVDHLNVRTEPNLSSPVLAELNKGDQIIAEASENGWIKTTMQGQTVWVSADYLTSSSNGQASQTTSNLSSQSSKDFVQASGNLVGKTVVLDAGHGGSDPGSIALDNSYEKYLTLRATEAVAAQLRAQGANVIMTRGDDSTVSLVARAQLSQDMKPDAFVSLHYNAHTTQDGYGISTHFSNPYNGSDKLAKNVQNALAYYTPFSDRGVNQNNYYVLTYNDSPAILVELGFITNSNDLNQILSENHPTSVAQAISDGLIKYLN